MDFRVKDKQVRREYFIRYYYLSMLSYDCDPAMFMLSYLCKRLEFNKEQRFLLSFYYANTYNLPSSWVIWNEFPDYENVDLERLSNWNTNNISRIKYETDVKWSKGHLPKMFDSYKTVISSSSSTQEEFFKSHVKDTPEETFNHLYRLVQNNFYKFGRYTTWFYLQTLKEICGIESEPCSLLLEDYSTHTQRSALAFINCWDEKAEEKKYNYTADEIKELSLLAEELLLECKHRYPHIRFDYYNMETCLCAFKKTFRKKKGRYIGYYHDRVASNIDTMASLDWPGINWNLLEECRNEMVHPFFLQYREPQQKFMDQFLDTGTPYAFTEFQLS